MTRSVFVRAGIGLAIVPALAACGGSGPSRADVVEPIVGEQIPARFDAFAATAEDLNADVTDWCESGGPAPTAEVADAIDQWYGTKPLWSGPVMERRSQFVVHFHVDPEGVAELLASDDPVDSATLRDFVGADQRGLGALAELLAGVPDERRCAYALGIAGLVAEEAGAVADEWHDFGPGLVTDDSSANDVIRDLVSNTSFALRDAAMDPEPAYADGLVDGARWTMLGDDVASDDGTGGLSPLLSDDVVDRLTNELDAGDLAAAQLTTSVDAVSELGVTLNFSDADGDG